MNNPYLRTICSWDWCLHFLKKSVVFKFSVIFFFLFSFVFFLIPLRGVLFILRWSILLLLFQSYLVGEFWGQFHSGFQCSLLPNAQRKLRSLIFWIWGFSLFALGLFLAIKLRLFSFPWGYLVISSMICVSTWGIGFGMKGENRSGIWWVVVAAIDFNVFWDLIPESFQSVLKFFASDLFPLDIFQILFLSLALLAMSLAGLFRCWNIATAPGWAFEKNKKTKPEKGTWFWMENRKREISIRPMPDHFWGRCLCLHRAIRGSFPSSRRYFLFFGLFFLFSLYAKDSFLLFMGPVLLAIPFFTKISSEPLLSEFLSSREFLLPRHRKQFAKERLGVLFILVGILFVFFLGSEGLFLSTKHFLGQECIMGWALIMTCYFGVALISLPGVAIGSWLFERKNKENIKGLLSAIILVVASTILFTPYFILMIFLNDFKSPPVFSRIFPWLLPFSLGMLAFGLFCNWVAYRQLCEMEFD